jgi:hypothetical protein
MRVDCVVVAAPLAPARDVARGLELADDAVSGSFGDPDRVGDLTQPGAGIGGDAEESPGVVGEEGPARIGVLGNN